MPRQGFYADALLYDILHAEGTAHDARVIARLVRAHGPRAPRGSALTILEPACGSGRYLLALAQRGHRAVGFDLESGMVRYARTTAKAAGVQASVLAFVARMEDFRVPPAWRAHGAVNLINSIRHLGSDRAMAAHLRSVRAALLPGGVYVVGLGLCAYGLESETEDVWRGGRTLEGVRTRVTQTVQYLPAPQGGARSSRAALREERVISHMVVTRGAGPSASERHIDSTYTLRSYNLAQWLAVVEHAGWEVLAVTDQDGLPMKPSEPGYFLWVLRPR
ncbi:MAG: class I SAM-dependent methyltransferase [Phycisphaerales bacterium]